MAVTDREGHDKVHMSDLYADRINCIAVNLRYDCSPVFGTEDQYRMNIDNEIYENIKHVAKGLNLNNIRLPEEISSMINLKNYVYKGK